MMIDFLNRVYAGAYPPGRARSRLDSDISAGLRLSRRTYGSMIPIVGGFVGLAKYKYQSNAEVARHRSSIIGSSAARSARRRGDRQQETVELNSKVPVRDERNRKQFEVKFYTEFCLKHGG